MGIEKSNNTDETLVMTPKRYLLVFILTVLGDFVGSCYSYLIAHEYILSQMFVGFLMPFIHFLSLKYFIDCKDMMVRLKITFVGACAMVIGSTSMLLLLRDTVN